MVWDDVGLEEVEVLGLMSDESWVRELGVDGLGVMVEKIVGSIEVWGGLGVNVIGVVRKGELWGVGRVGGLN